MEALIAGKSHSVIIGILRALRDPLLENWGQPDVFQREGLEVLAREGGGILYDEKDSPKHLDTLQKQVLRYRATYFRPIENGPQLEHLYRELDQAASHAQSPYQQGILWLGCRIQQAVIEFLKSEEAQNFRARVLDAVEEKRGVISKPLADHSALTLERIESVIRAFSTAALSKALSPFEAFALGGHLLETVRRAARRPPERIGEDQDPPDHMEASALVGLISDAVWAAEINEAKVRFSKLSDEEKKRRFNAFRTSLLPVIKQVAPYAPLGLDQFYQAIEATLYPYPEPIEFNRSFASALHANASQSTIFDNIQTPQAVTQRYELLIRTRQGNPLVLEIAKEMALVTFQESDLAEKKAYMREVDLHGEFGWPTTMQEMIEQI